MPERTMRFQNYVDSEVGVIEPDFLRSPLSVMGPPEARSVKVGSSVDEVMEQLKAEHTGCVLVLKEDGTLAGIFSERDYVLKVHAVAESSSSTIEKYMTAEPVTVTPDATIGFCLTLMSSGGFRHLPVVSEDGEILGMLSVKHIVDHIVGKTLADLDELADEEPQP